MNKLGHMVISAIHGKNNLRTAEAWLIWSILYFIKLMKFVPYKVLNHRKNRDPQEKGTTIFHFPTYLGVIKIRALHTLKIGFKAIPQKKSKPWPQTERPRDYWQRDILKNTRTVVRSVRLQSFPVSLSRTLRKHLEILRPRKCSCLTVSRVDCKNLKITLSLYRSTKGTL